MRVIEVGCIRTNVLPKHHDVFAREIRGPESGDKNVTVLHNVLLAHGSAEMHVHPESEHIFYVLRGELQVSDGKKALVVTQGNCIVIEAGEPHEVKGTGRVDCEYLAVTSPPIDWDNMTP